MISDKNYTSYQKIVFGGRVPLSKKNGFGQMKLISRTLLEKELAVKNFGYNFGVLDRKMMWKHVPLAANPGISNGEHVLQRLVLATLAKIPRGDI